MARIRSQMRFGCSRRLARGVVGALGGLMLAAGVGGCAFYANYPPVGNDAAVNDVNVDPIPGVTRAALAFATREYPVERAYVVNLPRGMDLAVAEGLMRELGDPDARLVSRETASLPTYHVTQIRIRNDEGTVQVLRPVTAAEEGGPGHQGLLLRMEGGLKKWRVVSHRAWAVGTIDPPPLYGWDSGDGSRGSR